VELGMMHHLVAQSTLIPFGAAHAADVLAWIVSADEARYWAGLHHIPVDPSVFAGWRAEPDTHAFVLMWEGLPAGYGEVWYDPKEGEVELARIVVKPSWRGRGVGRRLVNLLLDEAGRWGISQAFVRVHPDNAAALACYQRVGFRRVGPEREREYNRSQPIEYLWFACPLRQGVKSSDLQVPGT
jgi:ribosomal protein S18 acetylase RimI-like enzyme